MKFINIPNLPESFVKVVAISSKDKSLELDLAKTGIDSILISPCHDLDLPVNSHTDMLLHHLGKNKLVLAKKDICDEEKLRYWGFEISYAVKDLKKKYPNDVALNVARIGALAFGNQFSCEPKLMQYFNQNSIRFIHVNQGYTKCSTCIIDEHTMITADPSIYQAGVNSGLNVLKIPSGEINLSGYNTGFIGGCCGLIDKNKLAFYGDVKRLTYYDTLKIFLEENQIEIINLCKDEPVTDIGSIIPLLCK